jgi:hypothetical protein
VASGCLHKALIPFDKPQTRSNSLLPVAYLIVADSIQAQDSFSYATNSCQYFHAGGLDIADMHQGTARGATAGRWSKMSDEPLAREREPMSEPPPSGAMKT